MRAHLHAAGFSVALVLAACSGADIPADGSSGSGGGDGGNGTPGSGPTAGPSASSTGAGAAPATSTGEGPGPGANTAGPGPVSVSVSTGAGGSGDGGNSSGTGGEGGSPPDCTGDWTGTPERMLEVFDGYPGSVAVSRGELEMHLVLAESGQLGHIVRSVRSSTAVPFPQPTFADDLDVCDFDQDPYLDVSEDGLRAYITCADFSQNGGDFCPDGGCPILLAERASPADDFELTDTVGHAGFHPSLRSDELEVVTNGDILTAGVAPKVARRDTTGVDFDAAADVAIQLSGLGAVSGSTISFDGLELYAFARADNSGEVGLSRFTRSSTASAFGAREPISLWGDGTLATGAPDLTPDCRAMYVVRLANDGNGIDRIER